MNTQQNDLAEPTKEEKALGAFLIAMQTLLMNRYKAKGATLAEAPASPAAPEAAKPEQQAQAGEPEVVAYRHDFNNAETEGEPLITLQSHREAMAECEKAAKASAAAQFELLNTIAKKDAALKACVESWDKYWQSGRTEEDAIEFVLSINNAREQLK